jgi:signal transduction histidine kinase
MLEGLWGITPQRLQSCYEEIGRISGLVADLEQLAKAENDNLQLIKTDVDLLELVNVVIGNFKTESMKKNLSVHVTGKETVVQADKDRLNQVLVNLLSNAIKYTPENGRIQSTVKVTDQSGIVIIEDNGIGIPEKDLPFIFERFYRTDTSRSRSTGGSGSGSGSGLGLAIAKTIVTAHGGTITAESLSGKGSRFTLTLPK